MNYDAFLAKDARVQTLPVAEQKAFYQECLEDGQSTPDVMVHASYNCGSLYFWEGNFRKAIELTEPIVMEYQSLPFSKTLLGCFNLMATAMQCETEYVESRFIYGVALQIAKEHREKGLYAREYNNIASVYVMEQRYEDALHYLRQAEAVLQDSEVPMGAYIYLNKSIAYLKLNRLAEALDTYNTAVECYDSKEVLPYDTVLCGVSLYYKLGDMEKYEAAKEQTLAQLDEMHASEAMESCRNLFECGIDSGDEALVAAIFRTMDGYIIKHPQEIKVGLTMAELKYAYAAQKGDKDAMLNALQQEKSYQSRVIRLSSHARVSSMAKNFQITAELQRALESKERASQAKTQFLNSISHDIRTPLNGIIGLLNVDESHADDRKMVNDNRAKMQVAANHLLSLVNDVLDMSKIEEGSVVLAHEVLDFPTMHRELMSIIEPMAAERGVQINSEDNLSAKAPYVYGSPHHLRQIFLNIYGNCIKYNHIGGTVTARVEIVSLADGICTYRWTISDTGIGMSEAFLAHIFEPFVQERNDARSTYNGSGLGMSIVKGLVEQMDGTVAVSSQEGVGSTFTITIPFEIAPPPEPRQPKPAETASIQRMQLLLAEDNELNAEIAEILLTDKGASVTLARDGKQAAALFEASQPGAFDAILMDVMMPVMDGLAATRAIRALERPDAKTVPIIAMTANAYREDAEACIRAGMNAHLAKPLDMGKVFATIAGCCAGREK